MILTVFMNNKLTPLVLFSWYPHGHGFSYLNPGGDYTKQSITELGQLLIDRDIKII